MSTVYTGFEALQKYAKVFRTAGSNAVREAVFSAVAYIGAEGRKKASRVEESTFSLGGAHVKNGRTHGSVFDTALGGYRSRSDGRRMMGWSWEKADARKNLTKTSRAIASARFSSILANLWEQRKDGKPSKNYFFSRVGTALDEAVPIASEKTDQRIQEILDRAGVS